MRLVVWVDSLDAKEAQIATQPKVFFTTPHYDGYPMVLVQMPAVSQKLARELIEESWRIRAPASLVRRALKVVEERAVLKTQRRE